MNRSLKTMSRKDAEEELARLRAEQTVIREAHAEQRRLIQENLVRLEEIRQTRYEQTPKDVRLLTQKGSSMCFRVDAAARYRVLEAEMKERARREK
jgi:hypothetical protein